MDLLCFKKCPRDFCPETTPRHLQDTYINDKLLASALSHMHGLSETGHERGLFFLYLVFIVRRNYKSRETIVTSMHVRYTFSFTLNLKITLIQKMTTFYM